jgi:CubicO group peptidase (beta-lactamase class C family)
MFFFQCARAAATVLLLACTCAAVGADTEPESIDGRIGASIEREHAADHFDGVVLVARDDTVVYQRAIGFANRRTRQIHRVDEPWRLASVSKQVAALLVMQQLERGRLTLETRLDKLLPNFRAPMAASISVRQLLQHTSGLPNPDASLKVDAPAETIPPYYTARFKDDAGPVDAALEYCARPQLTLPGTRFSYNNCDTLIVQAILERITGQPYARLLEEAVTVPMKLDFWSMATATGVMPALPIGYLDAHRIEPSFNLASFGASDALVGSA